MAWPTTNDPRTEFVTVRFSVNESADIDWLVATTGARSRSEAVRNAVDRVVAYEKRKAARVKRKVGIETVNEYAEGGADAE